MYYRTILSIFLALLLTTSAWAGIQPGTFTLSPMVGGHIFENDQQLENSLSWSFGLGFNLTERAALEAVFSHSEADGDTAAAGGAKVQTYRVDALYHFRPQQQLVPYFAVGFGEIVIDPDQGSNRDHLLADIGGGIKYFLNDRVALRADVRYLLDFPEPKNNLVYSAGLVFQLGTPDAAPAPAFTPEPTPILPPAPAPPRDSDADGVIDGTDQCPDTPQGAAVNSIGCPIDSDADGIPDYRDKCPETPRGVSVDKNGCTTKLTLRINFGLDSAQIDPGYDDELAKAAQCINNYPGNVIFIDGHTDSQGPAEYNRKLSERRALSVKIRLQEKFNIPASRLTGRGFGESVPIADNNSRAGRLQNRRVEVSCGATQ